MQQLRDYVAHCAQRYSSKTAFIHNDEHRTWQQVHRRSDQFAAALQGLGLGHGDRVAILSRNRIEIAEHWFACLKSGMVRVGINWRYSLREMLHVARDSQVKFILVDSTCVSEFEDGLAESEKSGCVIAGFGENHGLALDYETLLAAHATPKYPPIASEDLAMIAYTSGTTGLPKGVVLTHEAVHDNALHTVLELGFQTDDVRAYVSNPAGVNIFQVCFGMFTGMTTVLDDFETERFLELVRKYRITRVTLIPTMLGRVIEAVKRGGHDVSSLKQIYYGSMPTTPALIQSAYEVLGCEFVQGYGVSESCGPIAALTNEDHRRALAGKPELLRSIGKAFLNAEMSVRDDEGAAVAPGKLGTIWIKSGTIMKEYLNLPEETASILELPWLKTGDHGYMDEEGYIYLGDRKKHMIISGGMNIYPTSIENALAEHAAVHEVVVVGVPHPSWGEAVVAVVSLRSDAQATVQELLDHCDGRLPRWEIPKYLEIVDELPQGNTDKLNKRQVLEHLIQPGRLPWAIPA